jgi:hypothetical protein
MSTPRSFKYAAGGLDDAGAASWRNVTGLQLRNSSCMRAAQAILRRTDERIAELQALYLQRIEQRVSELDAESVHGDAAAYNMLKLRLATHDPKNSFNRPPA